MRAQEREGCAFLCAVQSLPLDPAVFGGRPWSPCPGCGFPKRPSGAGSIGWPVPPTYLPAVHVAAMVGRPGVSWAIWGVVAVIFLAGLSYGMGAVSAEAGGRPPARDEPVVGAAFPAGSLGRAFPG